MTLIIVLISLIVIGVLAHLGGLLVEKVGLPSLIGMMIVGMFLGPYFFNVIPAETIKISPQLKDVALVTVLFIAGLGISKHQMKKIGRPAVLLSAVPATLEGFTIAILATIFLEFTFVQGAILGFIIAAVSPAVLVPSMVSLIDRRLGENKSIPQMLLVGASADDSISITFFTSFVALYLQSSSEGATTSFLSQMLLLPFELAIAIGVAWVTGTLIAFIIKKLNLSTVVAVLLAFIVALGLRSIESQLHVEAFNSLLCVMFTGFFIRASIEEQALSIQTGLNQIWKYGKLFLFAFVGMAINPMLVQDYFFMGLLLLTISLTIRSIGVLLSLIGTDLNRYERLFCVVAYLPKATVQSAKAGIPLQLGIAGGDIMQALAILSVLITAPIGAIGIKLTAPRWLEQATHDVTE